MLRSSNAPPRKVGRRRALVAQLSAYVITFYRAYARVQDLSLILKDVCTLDVCPWLDIIRYLPLSDMTDEGRMPGLPPRLAPAITGAC